MTARNAATGHRTAREQNTRSSARAIEVPSFKQRLLDQVQHGTAMLLEPFVYKRGCIVYVCKATVHSVLVDCHNMRIVEVYPDNHPPFTSKRHIEIPQFRDSALPTRSMWELDAQEASRQLRVQRIQDERKRDVAANTPLNLMERVRMLHRLSSFCVCCISFCFRMGRCGCDALINPPSSDSCVHAVRDECRSAPRLDIAAATPSTSERLRWKYTARWRRVLFGVFAWMVCCS